MEYGTGEYTFEIDESEIKLRQGFRYFGASGLAIDSEDNVFMFSRRGTPVNIFDRDNNLVASWGVGMFAVPHGIFLAPDGSLYCTDDMNHTVSQFTRDGQLLSVMGEKNKASDTGYVLPGTEKPGEITGVDSIKRGGPPFNRPTQVAMSKTGEIYVSDGYGNARVHKFTPDGKTLLFSWGEPGTGPGQFRLPHFVWVDSQERVWVIDRENCRIQIFDDQGKYLTEWTGIGRPSGLFIDKDEKYVYVSESDWSVCIFNFDGKLLLRFDTREDKQRNEYFMANFGHLHTIVVNSRGDIYTAAQGYTKKFVRKI
ncbi:peptidyl-alpha-hydroxyglycine alpha-amidating lyase family protein [Chloroflexota bacterium]